MQAIEIKTDTDTDTDTVRQFKFSNTLTTIIDIGRCLGLGLCSDTWVRWNPLPITRFSVDRLALLGGAS